MNKLLSLLAGIVLAACSGPIMTFDYKSSGIDRMFGHAASDGDVSVVVLGAPAGWEAKTAAALQVGNGFGPRARFVARRAAEVPRGEAFIAVHFEPPRAQASHSACENLAVREASPPGGHHLQVVLCSEGVALSEVTLIVPPDADLFHALTQAMGVLVPPYDPQLHGGGGTVN